LKVLFQLWKIAAVFGIISFLTGCWSSSELNNRAFVSVMIVDLTDSGIELTLGIPLTNRLIPGQTGGSDGGGGREPIAFVTRTGGTLEEALQKIQGDIPRIVTFGQTHCIILGNRLARRGIEPILEFVVRNPLLRLNTNLFMVEGQARLKVAKMPSTFERFFASVLNGYVRNNQILSTTVKDLMYSEATGGDGVIPLLRFDVENPLMKAGSLGGVGTAGAVILREGKMVTPVLSPEETSTARLLLGQLKRYIYSVQSPTDGKNVGFYTSSIRTDIRPFRTRKGLGITIRSYSDAGIIASDSNIDLRQQSNVNLLENEIKQLTDKATLALIDKTRQSEADVFNFGQYLSVQYPQEWNKIKKNWRTYYKNRLEVKVDTVISLRRLGSSTDSLQNQQRNED
jgi:spore germination protein KC